LPHNTNAPRSRAAILGLSLLAATELTACGSGSSASSSNSGGGTGGTGSSGNPSIVVINQEAADLVWDPVNQVIYLSVPSTAGTNANTISVLNPLTGDITKSVSIGNDPDVLALSAGSQYLYVGLDGSSLVQRLILPDLTPDVSYSLGGDPVFGPYIALDLQVAPGDPHTTAVTSGTSSGPFGGITIYDDATPRPTMATGTTGYYDSLQWGSDDTALYAANTVGSGGFYALAVNTSGVTLSNTYPNILPEDDGWAMNIHYDAGIQLIYDDNGSVVDPNTGKLVGSFTASPTSQQGVMVPDSSLNAAFFLYQTSVPYQLTIESFDINKFTSIAQSQVNPVGGTPLRVIRWGTNGLAFNTYSIEGTNQVFVVRGSIVANDVNATSNRSGHSEPQAH